MVQLSDNLVRALSARASKEGVSRSHLIRDAIELLLADDRSTELDRQIVEGYRAMPQGGVFDADEWGDVDRLMTDLTADQGRRLSDEEREAAHQPRCPWHVLVVRSGRWLDEVLGHELDGERVRQPGDLLTGGVQHLSVTPVHPFQRQD